MPASPLQKYEFNLRIGVTQANYILHYLRRIPDPQEPHESGLHKAIVSFCDAIEHLQEWAQQNGVTILRTMKT